MMCFFFQAEDGIRDLVRSRGLGDVYKRQGNMFFAGLGKGLRRKLLFNAITRNTDKFCPSIWSCLLYTSDAADERSSVDLGGRRIIKKKTNTERWCGCVET